MVEDQDSDRLTDVVNAVGPPDHSDDDPVGMRIGRGTEVGGYVIEGELGHGGMGVVYAATHPVIGKRAAIKILRPEVSRSAITVERFIQEARAVNQIGHPNIIDIFAYGALPDGRAYHVMDLLVGESLRKRLKRGVLHPSEAASVIDEIASALAAAHDHGFVHRDLKPDNVFLVAHEGRWPEVKLLDFGLAKLMPEYGVAAFTTKAGVMLGTPEYMSPEQARGIGVDYRTDIYALGVVMFEILAGGRPFPPLGDSFATLLQHAEEPPLSLADMVSGLPDEMVQLVHAMLAKTPAARPSLAAVRTVIKRLRTTQLPTRSLAGQAVADYSPVRPPLAISPSRVGAQAVLPGDPLDGRSRRISQPAATTPGVGLDSLRMSAPGPLHSQQLPRSASGSQPMAPVISTPSRSGSNSQPPPVSHPALTTGAAGGSTLLGGHAVNAAVNSTLPGPGVSSTRGRTNSSPPPSRHISAPPLQPASPPVGLSTLPASPPPAAVPHHPTATATATATAAEQAMAGSTRIPATERGVGPPRRSAPQPAAATRGRRTWLVLAGLLVVAAGIALAIAM